MNDECRVPNYKLQIKIGMGAEGELGWRAISDRPYGVRGIIGSTEGESVGRRGHDPALRGRGIVWGCGERIGLAGGRLPPVFSQPVTILPSGKK